MVDGVVNASLCHCDEAAAAAAVSALAVSCINVPMSVCSLQAVVDDLG